MMHNTVIRFMITDIYYILLHRGSILDAEFDDVETLKKKSLRLVKNYEGY